MTMNGQPSAPPFQNFRARWQQSPLTMENVVPLFDYETYRATRNGATAGAAGVEAPGYMGLSSIVNASYESPYDHMGMQQPHYSSNSNHYQNAPYLGSSSVRAAVGPPAYMAGGGYDSKDQKAQRQDEGQTRALSQFSPDSCMIVLLLSKSPCGC